MCSLLIILLICNPNGLFHIAGEAGLRVVNVNTLSGNLRVRQDLVKLSASGYLWLLTLRYIRIRSSRISGCCDTTVFLARWTTLGCTELS